MGVNSRRLIVDRDIGEQMKSDASQKPQSYTVATKSAKERADAFARELTDLTRKHGIGMSGRPTTFVMEAEDFKLAYEIDPASNLFITAA